MAICSKNNIHARIVLYGAIGGMIANRQKQPVEKKQVKRSWRQGIFKDQKLHSEYHNLYQSSKDSDREFHYRYLRMSKKRVDHLLGLLRDKFTKEDTNRREAVTAEERLVITLRYPSKTSVTILTLGEQRLVIF